MAKYASNTSVSADRSRSEIESTLTRYGATSFAYGWQGDRSVIQFAAHGRQIRFELPLPSREERRFTHSPTGKVRRSMVEAERAWEQGCRSAWRSLTLIIKAKLEAVEAGVSEFETEFLPYTVLPGGETVSTWLQPQIDEAYRTGVAPRGLLELGA